MKFPDGFISHLLSCSGFDPLEFSRAHEEPAPVSVHVNNKKDPSLFLDNEKVPWTSNSFYLKTRPAFIQDPLLHAGAYYVQEASGMFIEFIFEQLGLKENELKVLDLCAAPGGKSTLLASITSEESVLVSNEVIRSRVGVLQENLVKWGNSNVIVTSNDPADFSSMSGFFDLILVDAPCSGSGLFRKDPKAMREWSMENVLHCAKRQKRILDHILPALKQDGILIYTTCSYSREENEDIVDYVRTNGMQLVEIKIPEEFNIVRSESGFRFYPYRLKGEGFFASVLQKKNQVDQVHSEDGNNQVKINICGEEVKNIIAPFIQNREQYLYFEHREIIYAIQKEHGHLLNRLLNSLRIIKAGTAIGKIVRNELIPAHDLATSFLLNKNIPSVELSNKLSMRYLRKETLSFSDIPEIAEQDLRGWLIVKYNHIPIGWIKVLQERINNYYPPEWRVRNV